MLVMSRYCFIAFFIFFLFSCIGKKSDNVELNVSIIPMHFKTGTDDNVKLKMSTIIDTVEYIRIITPEDKDWIIGEMTEVQWCRDKYFIYDNTSKSIFVLSNNGIIENCLNEPGRGPDEYLTLTTFDVNSSSMEICVLDEVLRRIQIYSSKGEYRRTVHLNDIVRDMAVLPNGDFLLYTPDYMEGNRRGLWRVDSNGKFKEHHVAIDDDFLYGGLYPKYFRKINDSLIGLMGGEDYDRIYHISCDSVNVAYQLDVDIEIPNEIAENELFDFEGEAIYTKNQYFETDNFLHVKVQSPNDFRLVYYDTQNKEIISQMKKGSVFENDYGFYGYFSTSSNGYLFTYLPVGAILQSVPEVFPDITENSNPILVRYKLKKSFN